MRPRLLMVAALALVAASATAAWACSCVRHPSARVQLEKADVMFVGVAQRTVVSPGGGGVTRFTVSRTLKGGHQRVREVSHGLDTGGACGVRFTAGKRYVVIAHRSEGRLSTNSCAMPQFPLADFEKAARAASRR